MAEDTTFVEAVFKLFAAVLRTRGVHPIGSYPMLLHCTKKGPRPRFFVMTDPVLQTYGVTGLYFLTWSKRGFLFDFKKAFDTVLQPHLTPITGETFSHDTAITDPRARLDIKARNFWRREKDAFFDVCVTHVNAQIDSFETGVSKESRNQSHFSSS